MEGENQRKLEKLDKHLINIESLLEASTALDGSNVTTLDIDQMIHHLTSQLSSMVAATAFEGNDSIIFLIARLTHLLQGLRRLGFNLTDLEKLINEAVAEMCTVNKIEPKQIGINHDWSLPLVSWTHNRLSLSSNPPKQYVYLVHVHKADDTVHVMKTATGGRIEWSRPLIIREIEIGWSSSSNRIRVYYPGPGHGNNTPTKSSIPTPPGTVYFLESVNRSDALKIIDKLSTIGTVRSVVIKTRDEMDVLYAIRPRGQPAAS